MRCSISHGATLIRDLVIAGAGAAPGPRYVVQRKDAAPHTG